MSVCSVCNIKILDLSSYKNHVNHDSHKYIKVDRWYCPVSNCYRFFDFKKSFIKHLNSHDFNSHLKHLNSHDNNSPLEHLDTHDSNSNLSNYVSNDVPNPLIEDNASQVEKTIVEELKLSFFKTIISLLADISIARSKALEIIKKTHSHSLSTIDVIRKTQNKYIDFYSEEDINMLSQLYDYSQNCVPSEYMIFKEMHKLNLCIQTKAIKLSDEGNIFYDLGDPILKEISFSLTLVVLRDLFEKLFQIPSYLKLIVDFVNNLDYDTEDISNIMQTDFWKSKVPTVNEDRTLFVPLLVYFDDFETLNPIGSKSGLYKIGGVYVKLMCLPASVQSQILYTHLAMLFFTEDRKTFKDEAIFTPLIEELNYLQNVGIKVKHSQYDLIKIIPIIICGDNLGLNGILSFTECFVANFWCRFCIFSNKIMNTLTIADNEAMHRTKENYASHVIINNLSLTGVKQNSTFNNLSNFHVTENFCVDFAHDFLEGNCQIDMAQLLISLIHKYKWFTLEQLNSRIKSFNKSFKRSNKLGNITEEMLKSKKIRASASEMLNFVETFPLIISGLICDETVKEWVLYLTLRDIMTILMSPTVNEQEIQLLTFLITEHHELYLDCFDHLRAKPHLMIHYPTILRIIGPVLQVWTLRFESFHQIMKQTAKMSRNRVNLLKTFSVKNQFINANIMLNKDFSATNEKKGKEQKIGKDVEKYVLPERFNFANAAKLAFFQLNNIKYKPGLCVQLNDEELPTFGIIKEVFVLEESIFFGCQILKTHGFNRMYYSFSMYYEDSFQVIPLSCTFDSHVLYSLHKCVDFITLVRVR